MLPIYNTMRGCSNSLCQGKCNKFSFFFSAQKVLSNHVEVKFHSWFFKIHNNFLTSVWTQQTNNNCHILHGDGNGLSLGEPGAASLAGQGPFVHHSQAMGQVLHWLHNIQNQAGGQKPKWVLGLYTARPYNIRLYEWRRAVQPISSSGTLNRKIFFLPTGISFLLWWKVKLSSVDSGQQIFRFTFHSNSWHINPSNILLHSLGLNLEEKKLHLLY